MSKTRQSETALSMLYQLGLIESARSILKRTFRKGKLPLTQETVFHAVYEGSSRDVFVPPTELFASLSRDMHISRKLPKRYACELYSIVSHTLKLEESKAIKGYDCFRETVDSFLFKSDIDEDKIEGLLVSDESILKKLNSESKKRIKEVIQAQDTDLGSAIDFLIEHSSIDMTTDD